MRRTRRTVVFGAFGASLVLATLVALEIGAFALLGRGSWPSRARLQDSLATATAVGAPEERTASNSLHPYLGFTRNADPTHPTRVNRLLVDQPVNEYGFLGPSPLAAKDPDSVRIAITGGSVAEELYLYAADVMAARLQQLGAFGGRRVEIVSAAVAGFKQPQQFFAISYLLILGAPIDVVVNLDGFNEVVLPFTDNVPQKLAPSYPFRWKSVAADGIDPGSAILIGRIAESEQDLERWRRRLDRRWIRNSSFALALWHVVRSRNERARSGWEIALREKLGAGPNRRKFGPRFDASADSLLAHSIGIWRRSSEALASVCRDRQILYLHVLQPNQYVSGSKVFDAEQRRVALLPADSPTRRAAEIGYRSLLEQGARMREAGRPFVDLTAIFGAEPGPIYRDRCCHLFEGGYRVLADRIASEVDRLARNPGPGTPSDSR